MAFYACPSSLHSAGLYMWILSFRISSVSDLSLSTCARHFCCVATVCCCGEACHTVFMFAALHHNPVVYLHLQLYSLVFLSDPLTICISSGLMAWPIAEEHQTTNLVHYCTQNLLRLSFSLIHHHTLDATTLPMLPNAMHHSIDKCITALTSASHSTGWRGSGPSAAKGVCSDPF